MKINVEKLSLNYFILFHSECEFENEAMLRMSLEQIKQYSLGAMHLFDNEMTEIIPALEYVLHLPANGLQLYNLDERLISKAHDNPNCIIPIPDTVAKQLLEEWVQIETPTLIIYQNRCEGLAKKLCEKYNPVLGVCNISELSNTLLKKHWEALYKFMECDNEQKVEDLDIQFVFRDDMLHVLPLLFYSRQFKNTSDVLQRVYNAENIWEACYNIQLRQVAHINTLLSLHSDGIHDLQEATVIYEDIYQRIIERSRVNIIITFPGIPKAQMKYGGRSDALPMIEKRVIRIIGIHRAIAKNGILIELPCVFNEAFEKCNELELLCQKGTNNKHVWKLLRDLGKLIQKHFNGLQWQALLRAEAITVFSDLPIGLAIFDGMNSPLCCYKSVISRPLTPLTRNLQMELVNERQYYIGYKCKVIVAECIDEKDSIRKYADQFAYMLNDMRNRYKNFEVQYKEIKSISQLKQFTNENTDADILLISAHGSYDRQHNIAGIVIGDEIWMAEGNGYWVPPIVLLSACHVSPRGSGAVTIADLLRRQGAMAVLGTFIPVDVRKNALLLLRLFTYILEAQNGSKQFKTLDEVWRFVVYSNAVVEIMSASSNLSNWMMEKNKNGISRLEEFTLHRSRGRLSSYNIYETTIEILKEMLKDDGKEGKFMNIFDEYDFFPESIFYQFLGFPENIFVYNDVYPDINNPIK